MVLLIKFFALILVCFALLTQQRVGAASEFQTIRQYVKPLLVREADTKGRIVGVGSAIVITPHLAITAGHMFKDSNQRHYVVVNGREQEVRPIKLNKSRDVAVVSGKFSCPCAPIGEMPVSVDQDVVSVGFPLYTLYNVQFLSRGSIQSLDMEGFLVSSTSTAPGGSGGGLFRWERGEYRLVGLVAAIGMTPIGPANLNIIQEYNWITFSVPLETIRFFLNEPQN